MKRKQTNRTYSYANLETRNMLTGISFDAVAGTIVFNGTSVRDVVRINNVGNAQIVVVYEGVDSQVFNAADVHSIEFYGRNGSDTFDNNTSINSIAYGHLGNDNLYGGSGNDQIHGGKGNDDVRGYSGDDIVLGGNGNDMVRGGRGADVLHGHAGDDNIRDDLEVELNLIHGGAGDDVIMAGVESVVYGNLGNDRIFGGAELIFGGSGNDTISSGAFEVTVYAGDGDDEINTGAGDDTIFGGEGDDVITDRSGTNMIYGGAGDDHVDARLEPPPFNPNLMLLTENDIFGGEGDDTIIGGRLENRIFGGAGNDIIYGGPLDDLLAGGDGFDEIFGNEGDDEIYGGIAHDYLDGGDGNDRLFGQNGNDHIRGGNQDDQLFGGYGNDRHYGMHGDDLVFGGPGLDGLAGGYGHDVLNGGPDADRFLTRFSHSVADLIDIDVEIQIGQTGILSLPLNQAEVEVLDSGLQLLHLRTQNRSLLADPLSQNPIVLLKSFPIVSHPRIATTTVLGSTRFYHIGDFDELDADVRELIPLELTREFARIWANDAAINVATSSQDNDFTRFRSISGWTNQPPNENDYVLSLDGFEYFLAVSTFADDPIATVNSKNDFISVWRALFTPDSNLDLIGEKVDLINQLFNKLS